MIQYTLTPFRTFLVSSGEQGWGVVGGGEPRLQKTLLNDIIKEEAQKRLVKQ